MIAKHIDSIIDFIDDPYAFPRFFKDPSTGREIYDLVIKKGGWLFCNICLSPQASKETLKSCLYTHQEYYNFVNLELSGKYIIINLILEKLEKGIYIPNNCNWDCFLCNAEGLSIDVVGRHIDTHITKLMEWADQLEQEWDKIWLLL